MKRLIVALMMVVMMASTAYGAEKEQFYLGAKESWMDNAGNEKEYIEIMRSDDAASIVTVKTNGKVTLHQWHIRDSVDSNSNSYWHVITIVK